MRLSSGDHSGEHHLPYSKDCLSYEINTNKLTYDLKMSIVVLNKYGININNCNFDVSIAGYLSDYEIKDGDIISIICR